MTFGRFAVGEVPNARIGNRRLAVEHQADRLHRLDRKRLMSFDQRTVMRKVMHADCVTGVEASPECSEHLESHPGAAIARCSHHCLHLSIAEGASATRLPHIRYIFPRGKLYFQQKRCD